MSKESSPIDQAKNIALVIVLLQLCALVAATTYGVFDWRTTGLLERANQDDATRTAGLLAANTEMLRALGTREALDERATRQAISPEPEYHMCLANLPVPPEVEVLGGAQLTLGNFGDTQRQFEGINRVFPVDTTKQSPDQSDQDVFKKMVEDLNKAFKDLYPEHDVTITEEGLLRLSRGFLINFPQGQILGITDLQLHYLANYLNCVQEGENQNYIRIIYKDDQSSVKPERQSVFGKYFTLQEMPGLTVRMVDKLSEQIGKTRVDIAGKRNERIQWRRPNSHQYQQRQMAINTRAASNKYRGYRGM